MAKSRRREVEKPRHDNRTFNRRERQNVAQTLETIQDIWDEVWDEVEDLYDIDVDDLMERPRRDRRA